MKTLAEKGDKMLALKKERLLMAKKIFEVSRKELLPEHNSVNQMNS